MIPGTLMALDTILFVTFCPRRRASGEPKQPRWRETLFGQALSVLLLGVLFTVAFSAVLGLAMGLPWGDPDWIEATRLGLTLAAALGGAFALVVNYRKQRVLENQHAQAKVVAERDELTAAAQQLGSDAPATRLAGVYALIHLADANAARAQECVDVLCGHLRFPWPLPEQSVTDAGNRAELEVRRTALRLIGEHLRPTNVDELRVAGVNVDGAPHHSIYRRPGLASWSALSFDFTQARLPRFEWDWRLLKGQLDFTGSTFAEPARFTKALFAQQVYFDRATFEDAADFDGATFTDVAFGECRFNSIASFILARLSGQAWFQKAQFEGTTDFQSVSFEQGCNFTDAEFSREARFDHATFAREMKSDDQSSETATFNGARFDSRAWFKKCRFNGAADFTAAMFGGSAGFDDVVANQQITFRAANFVGDREFGERPPYDTDESAVLSFDNARVKRGLDLGAAVIQCQSRWTGALIEGNLDLTFGVPAAILKAPLVEGAALNGAPLRPEDLGWHPPA